MELAESIAAPVDEAAADPSFASLHVVEAPISLLAPVTRATVPRSGLFIGPN
jgi:hypothetical protein